MSFYRQQMVAPIDLHGQRGWGPFTGRQLTTIVVALILVLAFPAGAFAFSVTHTSIVDNKTKTPVLVDNTGSLHTDLASPANSFQGGAVFVNSGAFSQIAAPAAGSALIADGIHIGIASATNPGAFYFEVSTGTTCSGSQIGSYSEYVYVTGYGDDEISLTPGLGIPAGDGLCAAGSNGAVAFMTVSGHSVPAGTVTAATGTHLLRLPPRQR